MMTKRRNQSPTGRRITARPPADLQSAFHKYGRARLLLRTVGSGNIVNCASSSGWQGRGKRVRLGRRTRVRIPALRRPTCGARRPLCGGRADFRGSTAGGAAGAVHASAKFTSISAPCSDVTPQHRTHSVYQAQSLVLPVGALLVLTINAFYTVVYALSHRLQIVPGPVSAHWFYENIREGEPTRLLARRVQAQ
jgi:hypothetical protein